MGTAKQGAQLDAQSAREEILARVPPPAGGEAPPIVPEYPQRAANELQERLLRELRAVGAKTCVAAQPEAAREYVQAVAAQKGGAVVFAERPAVLALGLQGGAFHPLGAFPTRDAAVSVTQADYALAETGTLVLFSEPGEGRTLSLLAPTNVCVVPASRLLWDLAELFSRQQEPARRSSAMIFVTGPSRTADIELTLTVGVHGPGELHVILLTFM